MQKTKNVYENLYPCEATNSKRRNESLECEIKAR